MQRLHVELGERSYEIIIGIDILDEIGVFCKEIGLKGQCAIITDTNVAPLYAQKVLTSLNKTNIKGRILSIKAGEKSKNLTQLGHLLEQMANIGLDRGSFVIALGGGVVGDIAGFAAAIYMRGIPYVQVPTSLLAQVDSSVGGKTAINLKTAKNLVGSFYQPRLVVCDIKVLQTLPVREFKSGIAEIIKYGLIADAEFFSSLERELEEGLNYNLYILQKWILRSCQIKASVVQTDETESGLRAILNFGHTIGHAIENVSGYGHYLHGEAIAIGQVAAAWLSHRLLGLTTEAVNRINTIFKRASLPTTISCSEKKFEKLLMAIQKDKKTREGSPRFVLLEKIGKAVWGIEVAPALIKWAISKR